MRDGNSAAADTANLSPTGFAIGGVAPVGHVGPVRVVIDRELFEHDELWAAAGGPSLVFRTDAATLEKILPPKFSPADATEPNAPTAPPEPEEPAEVRALPEDQ